MGGWVGYDCALWWLLDLDCMAKELVRTCVMHM